MCNIVYWFMPGDRFHTFNDLCTSLNSVKLHRRLDREYKVYVYYCDVDKDTIGLLKKFSCNGFEVETVNLSVRKDWDSMEVRNAYINKMLVLKDMANKVDDFLFLDIDVLVRCDVSWYTDNVENVAFSGFFDYYMPETKRGGCPPDYVNVGFIVINSQKLKEEANWNDLIAEARRSQWPEQDAMNHQLSHSLFPREKMVFLGKIQDKYGNNTLEYLDNVDVFHYAGIFKGISNNIDPFYKDLWASYTPAFCRQKVYLNERSGLGLGDAILFSDIVTNLNLAHLEFDIDIQCDDMTDSVLTTCGCQYTRVYQKAKGKYSFEADTPSYINKMLRGTHLAAQGMHDFCKQSGLPASDFSPLKLSKCAKKSEIWLPRDYVLVPSLEPEKPRSMDKSWHRWQDLVTLLKTAGYNVYELNTWTEHNATYHGSSDIIYAKTLADSAKILKNAKFVVTTENGLNHWACHNGAKSYCLLLSRDRAHKEELAYKTMVPVECYEDDSAEHVMSVIKEHEK